MVRIHKCSKQKESCAIVISPKTFEYFKYNDEVIKNMLCFYYFANLTEDIFFDLFKLRASRGLSRINVI